MAQDTDKEPLLEKEKAKEVRKLHLFQNRNVLYVLAHWP